MKNLKMHNLTLFQFRGQERVTIFGRQTEINWIYSIIAYE